MNVSSDRSKWTSWSPVASSARAERQSSRVVKSTAPAHRRPAGLLVRDVRRVDGPEVAVLLPGVADGALSTAHRPPIGHHRHDAQDITRPCASAGTRLGASSRRCRGYTAGRIAAAIGVRTIDPNHQSCGSTWAAMSSTEFGRPQARDDGQLHFEPGEPVLRERDAVGRVLLGEPAAAQARLDPAAGPLGRAVR